MDYPLCISQDTLHGIFYGNIEIMIIGLPHNLKYCIAYKIILLDNLIILIRNSLSFFLYHFYFTWKFSLIFWKFNRSFFTNKYLNFYYFFSKRAEQIRHYFVDTEYSYEIFHVFRVYHFWMIDCKLSKVVIYAY